MIHYFSVPEEIYGNCSFQESRIISCCFICSVLCSIQIPFNFLTWQETNNLRVDEETLWTCLLLLHFPLTGVIASLPNWNLHESFMNTFVFNVTAKQLNDSTITSIQNNCSLSVVVRNMKVLTNCWHDSVGTWVCTLVKADMYFHWRYHLYG